MATSALLTPESSSTKATRARTRASSRFAVISNAKIVGGLAILGFFVLMAVAGPWLAPYDPSAIGPDVLQPPSANHLLGTTTLGEDVFSQVVAGARLSLLVGLVAAAVGETIAVAIGVTSAFAGGIVDELLTLLTNIFLVIPVLPLQILIIAYVGNGGWMMLAAVIALTTWSHGARKLRAQTLAVRHRDYIEAARANGEPWARTVFSELLPNLSAVVITSFVFHVTAAIVVQTGLAFLGLGDTSQWSWGAILHWSEEGNAFLLGAWWWFVPPGICLALISAGLGLVNLGVDEVINPRLRTGVKSARKRKWGRTGPTDVHAAQAKGDLPLGEIDLEIAQRGKTK